MLIFGSIIVIFEHLFSLPVPTFTQSKPGNYQLLCYQEKLYFPSLVCRIIVVCAAKLLH